ncbi:MAG: glycosyltransferase family 2 protein [candidate division Zixibacteria bacterium]|nr:glycosyltransferase family 2 protein [candidate division Zixibacteria bacterium]
MMVLLTILTTTGAFIILGIIVHLYFLAIHGLKVFKDTQESHICDNKSFLVLIPAHDEELVIKRVINSIRETDYNQDLIEIVVIADNCTDSTANIASSLDVVVLERKDHDEKGKGYAITWALNKLNIDNYDLVSIIDADNVLDKNFFKVTGGLVENGAEIVQTYFGYYNVAKTTYSYILYWSNLVENYLFYNSRSNLKLHVFLRGSGMVFKTNILKETPWKIKSVTEDANYSIELITNNRRVHFTTQTKVYEETLDHIKQSFSQRIRYNSGIISLIKNNSLRLLKQSILKKDLLLLETAFSLFLLNKPVLLGVSSILLATSLVFGLNSLISVISLFNIGAIVLYFGLGHFLNPQKGPLFKTLITMPFYGIYLLIIYILSSFGYKKNNWSKTPRVISDHENTVSEIFK